MSPKRTVALLTGAALTIAGVASIPIAQATTELDRAPLSTLTAPKDSGAFASGMTRDNAGHTYVVSDGTTVDAIEVYAPNATGGAEPIRVITGEGTGLVGPQRPAVDNSGYLYVPNAQGGSVTVYAPSADGDATPVRTIKGAATGFVSPSAVAIGPDGNLWVTDHQTDVVRTFRTTADGNVPPIRSFSSPSLYTYGSATIAFDRAGNIYIGAYRSRTILVFAATSRGSVAPARTLDGANTKISWPGQIAVDSGGHLYVADYYEQVVRVFGPGAKGDAAPTRELAGASTVLGGPWSLHLDNQRRLTVGNLETSVVATYAPLVPFTAPAAVRSLTVGGKAAAQGRSITWAAPDDGDPVTSYKVTVKRGNTTVYATSTTARRVDLGRNALKAGAHRVSVTAVNGTGSGPARTKAFTVTKTKPTKVTRLTVSGKKATAKRTVSWAKPTWDGRAAIKQYRVVVTKGGKTILRKNVAGTKRKLVIKRNALKNGVQKVAVQARNSAGYGPKASMKLRVKK